MNDKDLQAIRGLKQLGKRLRDGLTYRYQSSREVVNLPDVYREVVREEFEKQVSAGHIVPTPEPLKKNIITKPKPKIAKSKKKSHAKGV